MKLLLLATALVASVPLGTYSSKDSTHYLAAVVEYSPDSDVNLSGLPLVMKNILHYENLIVRANKQKVDIIVFPEVGLTGIGTRNSTPIYMEVPHPNETISPCLQPSGWSEPIRRLSCAARENRIYVAVNLKEQCGPKRHNTNVVFNREGVVVSRYRKLHLFNEKNLQVPDEKEFSVFDTDFGVTFGVAICFDLMFREPASVLSSAHNIKHFIYSTAWFSEVPFLTAVQTQAAWSWSHNAVMLASGLNSPQYGNTGSGIYVGRKGPITTIFTGQNITRLLIGRVPKDLTVQDDSFVDQTEIDKNHFESISSGSLHLLKDWIHAFATQLLPLEGTTEDNIKLCHNEFCCSFEIKKNIVYSSLGESEPTSSGTELEQYRLFVWNGVRDFGGAATGGVQLCGVVACGNATDVMTCGMPTKQSPRKVKFSKLQIRGAFETNNTMLLANTMNRQMLALPADSFDLTNSEGNCDKREGKTEGVKCMNMILLREQEIRTFAIYNRVFERDGSNCTHTKP